MADIQHRDLVRLTPYERNRLLNALDREDASAANRVSADGDRRDDQRWEYRVLDLALAVQQPGGGVSRFIVCSRNLSACGLAFLHGGYIYPGSPCSIRLPRFDGQSPVLTGEIVTCRHVERHVHEVSIRFQDRIEPQMFIQSRQTRRVRNVDSVALPDLRGDVLFHHDSASELVLLEHQLSSTDIELTTAPDRADVVRRLADNHFDVVLLDLNVVDDDAADLVAGIRTQGFEGPVVLLTPETDLSRLRGPIDSGVDHLLSKPYDPLELFALLYKLLATGTPSGAEQLYSILEKEDGMPELIAKYIGEARRLARLLDDAIRSGEMEQARRVCLCLKGDAAVVGFPVLGNAAADALTAIDIEPAEGDGFGRVSHQLRRLATTCRSLALRAQE